MEYACRAGTQTRYYHGDDPEGLAAIGNVADASTKRKIPSWNCTINGEDGYVQTAPVGQFRCNDFGLYDMIGNAHEWCSDWHGSAYYAYSPSTNPAGPSFGKAPPCERRFLGRHSVRRSFGTSERALARHPGQRCGISRGQDSRLICLLPFLGRVSWRDSGAFLIVPARIPDLFDSGGRGHAIARLDPHDVLGTHAKLQELACAFGKRV